MNFTTRLLSWYKKNRRDLPWRRTRDPYKIWISEIVLQQTRIEQGTGYYHRFLKRFRNVSELAAANEKDVLKLWQGLGYYSRARNLHHAAKEIVGKHNGKFPSDYHEIRGLKGIGDYTAAAISSIAFNQPYPVVDGNVLRFFSRYFGVMTPVDKSQGKKIILQLAKDVMNAADPGEFNQAMMEFGALQCKAGTPACSSCPFRKQCFAIIHGKVADLPVKSATNKPRKRYFNYLVMIYQDPKTGMILHFRKREENDIWKNLYDFPLIESSGPISQEKIMESIEWKNLVKNAKIIPDRSAVYEHVLTHQTIYARFYLVKLKNKKVNSFIPVPVNKIDDYPVPRLIEKFLVTIIP